jgi:hypothetical protein
MKKGEVARQPILHADWVRLLAIICVWLAGATVHAVPRVVCAQPAFEFVLTNGQSHVEHAFALGNEGDAPLVIEKIHACCGASVKLSLKTIPPATNSVLEVSMDLRGKSGQIRKSIYVHTNDPQCPILSIRLIGMVSPVVVSP